MLWAVPTWQSACFEKRTGLRTLQKRDSSCVASGPAHDVELWDCRRHLSTWQGACFEKRTGPPTLHRRSLKACLHANTHRQGQARQGKILLSPFPYLCFPLRLCVSAGGPLFCSAFRIHPSAIGLLHRPPRPALITDHSSPGLIFASLRESHAFPHARSHVLDQGLPACEHSQAGASSPRKDSAFPFSLFMLPSASLREDRFSVPRFVFIRQLSAWRNNNKKLSAINHQLLALSVLMNPPSIRLTSTTSLVRLP